MTFCNVTPSEVSAMQSVLSERGDNEVIVADHAVMVVENAMRRYAEKRSTQRSTTHHDEPTTSSSPLWYDAVKADTTGTVRAYPYPSLFLNPLPPDLCEYPSTPPSFLMVSSVPVPTKVQTSNGDSTGRRYRNMFALNGGAPGMVTVLQGECGLAVVSPHSPSVRSSVAYLMSPDATSCTIVACRVGLHPQLREAIMATAAGDAALLYRCCDTFTASMAHFDNMEGLVPVLHEMLWEAALPAWFHAVLRDDGSMGAEGDAVRAAEDLMTQLCCIAQTTVSATDSDAATPTLYVEWFVVGGIRSKNHTVPVLSAIFGAFFAKETDESSAFRSPRGQRHDPAQDHLLKSFFYLSEVLGVDDSAGVRGAPVRLEHRLREDGSCFWSLNTVLRPWEFGRAGALYSCPACWGILLDVGIGGCWPVMVEPGTRKYPLTALRHTLVQRGYRWMCPLEREGRLRVCQGTSTAHAAKYFGLGMDSSVSERLSCTLSSYVDMFLQRCGVDAIAGDVASLKPAPVLVRRCVWERQDSDNDLDLVPDKIFLGTSTTPHCEPPDYASIMRWVFTVMAKLGSEEVFVEETAGILL
ncbi:hypothetical protein LSM04_002379 [Trypanosoma melophagium]|uniref:uncharacterized protein n=1 Tax=Trypanosoma melophagium TaxID=715481 RepID=UPI00351A34E9|nr:hypothetical protein LSM04_002379 [Trypanosoma melophagium]